MVGMAILFNGGVLEAQSWRVEGCYWGGGGVQLRRFGGRMCVYIGGDGAVPAGACSLLSFLF